MQRAHRRPVAGGAVLPAMIPYGVFGSCITAGLSQ